MRKIDGVGKSIRDLLTSKKYAIDYYQREYKWQTKQVTELLDDLAEAFLEHYKPEDERSAVENYGHYFLGSIIVSNRNGQSFVIDGQQRLTTTTLLLIFLHNLQRDRADRVKLDDLIFSEKYAKKSFNLDVDERTPAMEALFNQVPFDPTDRPESVQNIAARYEDIKSLFSAELTGPALPYFVDWLIDNVHLVEITAYSDDDAYTIFETMNDRGLSLSPSDMLKGYLLANIADETERMAASKQWKERLGALTGLGKEEESDGLKTWLRSQHALTIRDRKKGALPGDFDRLGTEFHRWVREKEDAIGLHKSADFVRFIQRDLTFYTRWYQRVREAAVTFTPGLETIFYVASLDFTLQYLLLLAPLRPEDGEEVALRKIRIVAAYVDILLARRLWNFRMIAYSTMQYAVFKTMVDLRGKSPGELATVLRTRLDEEHETFASNDRLRVHVQNRYTLHRILARLTEYIETQSGLPSHYPEYVAGGKTRFEVEHIWADHPERHTDEFSNEGDFYEYRNRIGGLLLLPKTFNASYQDLPYQQKLPHYFGQNLLARSLHEDCYAHHPGFVAFVKTSGLPFQPHPDFKKVDLEKRQQLYRALAEKIWDPARLEDEAAAPDGAEGES